MQGEITLGRRGRHGPSGPISIADGPAAYLPIRFNRFWMRVSTFPILCWMRAC